MLESGALSIFGSRTTSFTAGAKSQLAGLMRVGKVTTATSTTIFESTDLIGQDDFAFEGWYVSVLQADNLAPEGEMQPMSAYESATGKVTHTAFGTQLDVGDWVVLLRPEIAMLGKVDTTAAEGPVTSTDYLMGYVKQIINELNGGSWTNMSGAANSNLDAVLQAIATVIGIDSANTFAPSINGSGQTTFEAAFAALGTILGVPARDLDTILGARWDSSGDLGTDIATLIGHTENLDSATGVFHEQADVSISYDTDDTEDSVLDLSSADTRYILRSLRLKFADPGANTVTVRLKTLIADASATVDTFTVTTDNYTTYFSLMDMFGVQQIAGDDIEITTQNSAAVNVAVTGQYSHAKTNV